MTPPAETELTLHDYLLILRRRIWWLIAPVLVLGTIATWMAVRAEPQYTATATVGLINSAAQDVLNGSTSTNVQLRTRVIENETNFATSDLVEQAVINTLGFLPRTVRVAAVPDSDYLDFTATATNPDNAALWANTWAETYVTTKQQEAAASIGESITGLEASLEEINDRIRNPRTSADEREALIETRSALLRSLVSLELEAESAARGTARVYVSAQPPESESGAPVWRTVLLGIVAGGVLGVALALAAESLDRTIKTAADVTDLTDLPVLGQVPLAGKWTKGLELALASRDHPDSPVTDAYRRIGTSMQFAMLGKNITSLLVTSANASEGKTTSAVNLAYTLAGPDMLVVLGDVDFRKPRLHSALDLDVAPGLSDHIIDDQPLEEMVFRNEESTLAVFPAGTLPPNPAEFVATREFHEVVGGLREVSDLVILDGPPVLPVSDSLHIARGVDAVVMVAASGVTTKDGLVRAVDSIRQVGGSVLGVILIGVKEESIYGQYGYGHYRNEAKQKAKAKAKADRHTKAISADADGGTDAAADSGNAEPTSTGSGSTKTTAKRNGTKNSARSATDTSDTAANDTPQARNGRGDNRADTSGENGGGNGNGRHRDRDVSKPAEADDSPNSGRGRRSRR